jgi:hypothetical protein
MSTVYRKSLKGIDELAFRSGTLSLRLTSYLLAVDGMTSADELAARNPHLPSMDVILAGLAQQGLIEAVQGAVAPQPAPLPMASPAPLRAPAAEPNWAASAPPQGLDLESTKADMVRDVSTLLGGDAVPVIAKIQNCRTGNDLFATMMGIKKIISLYVDKAAAEDFARRYQRLST